MIPPVQPRKLAKVPFVELVAGRLQGVVSSGSDPARVYVSSIAAASSGPGSHTFNCSTNNNRPCGGLSGAFLCNHLRLLIDEAVVQYGSGRVARHLRVEVPEGGSVAVGLHGSREEAPAAVVFSRFLRHLSYLELPVTSAPMPEMHWFPSVAR